MASTSTGARTAQNPPTIPPRPSAPVTEVVLRDGKAIGINDFIYISAPWAPGAGEPYLIARVMEFVTAASSRSGAAALLNPSGTLQVRANVYLRMRDISHRVTNDPRLLVATMHSDVFALENVRGTCEVRHRELIGDGTAPDVSAWKKRDDHFYYHQLYDRYIHRFYDVIPTEKVKNAPPEVLRTLRMRYSFIVAEVGMTADLCDALRGCAVCHRWAASVESVRCDTCKKFFHMRCLSPPLASKPAKGYSWTCAPCSRKHEQDVGLQLAGGSGSSSNGSTPLSADGISLAKLPGGQGTIRGTAGSITAGRGRGRGGKALRGRLATESLRGLLSGDASSDVSPDGSPAPERTQDDLRGTRCFNRWPYRYFGQHTSALDVLDPHDSIYPRAVTRLGPKFQAALPTWEEQKDLGLGVAIGGGKGKEREDAAEVVTAVPTAPLADDTPAGSPAPSDPSVPAAPVPKRKGRPPKRKRDEKSERSGTPLLVPATVPAISDGPLREFERGTDESVEAFSVPSMEIKDALIEAYLKGARQHFSSIPGHNVDLLNRALLLLTRHRGNAAAALSELSQSTPQDLRIVNWTAKEVRQFEAAIKDYNAEMKYLKQAIPTKSVAEIVRHFYGWKTKKLRETRQAELAAQGKTKGKLKGPDSPPRGGRLASTTRAVSPTLSVYAAGSSTPANTSCVVCSTTTSAFWYKGPYSWQNRALCVNCGLHWRKYAAESSHTDLLSQKKQQGSEDNGLGVGVPSKIARLTQEPKKAATPPPRPELLKCVMCRKIEPKKRLVQCRQCSLSVHQGCFGLTDEELTTEAWSCEACTNEKSLDAALFPRCILCPPPDLSSSPAHATTAAPSTPEKSTGRGRAKAVDVPIPPLPPPLTALDAVKPTECNNWTHLICAVWMPEVLFSDTERMKMVEGAGNLPVWRYSATCERCNQSSGACISCADPQCRRTFHISCAFTAQPSYTFGFEIQPVKSTRRDVVPTVTFKSETGHMSALVWCKDHKEVAKGKKLYELAEVDPATGLTALQTFVRSHKHVTALQASSAAATTADQTYALLRRAKRFDAVFGTSPSLSGPTSGSAPASAFIGKGQGQAQSSASSSSATFMPNSNANSHSHPLKSGTPTHATNANANGSANANANAAVCPVTPSSGPSSSRALSATQTQTQMQTHGMNGLDASSGVSGHGHGQAKSNGPTPPPKCVRCKTKFSPFWWSLPVQPPPRSSSPSGMGTGTGGGAGAGAGAGAGTGNAPVCCNQCRPHLCPDEP